MTTSSIGPGTVLGGRYQLQELLSEHEGARFWRATDTVLVRSVAVHALASDDPRAEALQDAARVSATVADPHLLRVLDCDHDPAEGISWVVHEWGAGLSLDLMLQRGPLPPARAAWLAREVAECIAAAHALGVPHGCLNPEHVLVTEAGAVKLIGFVVAAALQDADAAGHPDLDPREADVVNLAGVLYAALTGRWPGVAPSAVPPAPREGRRPLRPRQVRAGIPRTLDAICTRVLVREGTQHEMPVDTAHEVAAALSDYVGDYGLDPSFAAPLDLPSLHTEPTVTLPAAVPPTESAAESAAEPAAGSGGQAGADDGDGPATQLSPAVDSPLTSTAHGRDADPDGTQLHDALSEDTDAAPPPPPPFEDPPERPLFASTERRRNLPPGWSPGGAAGGVSTGAGGGPGTGEGTAVVPDPAASGQLTGTGAGTGGFWPFTVDDEPPPAEPTGREGRTWIRLAAVVAICLALVAAVAFAFRLGRDSGKPVAQPTGAAHAGRSPVSKQLQVVSATAFDPEGDQSENDAEAGYAIDGKPSTTWQTSTYYNNPRLGGLKSGVGLLLDLGATESVGSVRAHFVGSPTSVAIEAAQPWVHDPPTSVTDLQRVASNDSAGADTVLRVRPGTRTRYLVVWLTKLPPVPGGYRGEISDLSVWS